MWSPLVVGISLAFGQVKVNPSPPTPNAATVVTGARLGEPTAIVDAPAKDGAKANGEEKKDSPKTVYSGGFLRRLAGAYLDEFTPKEDNGNGEEPARRALPAPFDAPPFPTA